MALFCVPRRATTRRCDVVPAADLGALRTVVVPVVDAVADRAARGTTRRGADNCSVLTTVFIGLVLCDVVTPGFNTVFI